MNRVIFFTAIGFLISCLILSTSAYLWVPDNTTHANRQIPEASLQDPGAVLCFEKTATATTQQTFWNVLVYGRKDIHSYRMTEEPVPAKNQECLVFLFGTDKYGRDIFSRIFVGLRYTLFIGFAAVIFSLFLGVILGCIAGYFGGRTDQIISLFINVFWSLPTILLAFAIILSFGRSIVSIFTAIGLTMWGDVARLVRAQVLSARNLLFVQAGHAMGYSDLRIIGRHILPNIMGPVWVAAAGNFALAVLLESGLSFLGFGLQPPIPTLGNILQEQYAYAVTGKLMLAMIPSVVVVLLVLAFQLITNGLRDLGDVRMNSNQ